MNIKGNIKTDFDFHIHTIPGSADASQIVSEMIATAKEAGLKAIAITDHNRITSLKEAIPLCKEKGIELINGVELSCCIKGLSNELDYEIIHVLGLGIKADENLFSELTKEAEDRVNKWKSDIVKVCERVFNYKFKSNNIYDVRNEMVECGFVKNKKEAKSFMRSYRGNDITPLEPIRINEIVDVIHKLGGIAILAHPNRGENHRRFNPNEIEQIINYLVNTGLDGVELYHPDVINEIEAFNKVEELANKYNLVKSLGVDRHRALDAYGEYYYRQNDFINKSNINFDSIKQGIINKIKG